MSRKVVLLGGAAGALAAYYAYSEYGGCTYKGKEDLAGRVYILTGATNPGVGKETARELAKRGAHVILGGKNMERCHNTRYHIMHSNRQGKIIQNVDCEHLDLKSLKSIRKFVQDLPADLTLGGVINAAETVKKKQREETSDGLEKQMGVSHFGYFRPIVIFLLPFLLPERHFLLSNLLVEKYSRQPQPFRILALTYPPHSVVHIDFDDLNSTAKYAPETVYRRCKTATLLTVLEGSKRTTAASYNAVDPGSCNTEVFRHIAGDKSFMVKILLQPLLRFAFPSPEKACQTVLYAALSPELDNVTGKYIESCRVKELPMTANDISISRQLWQISQDVVANPEQFVASQRRQV